MNSDTFQFKIANGIDKPAIWFKLHKREVMIFPFELYNVLFDCFRERWICREVKANFQIFKKEVYGYYYDASYGSYQSTYQRDSFIESAIQSLKDLCGAVIRNEETAYQNFKLYAAEQMLFGLKDILIPQSYSQIKDEEIKIEPFGFEFVEPYSCDTHYVISIGDKKYESALSDWSTDFNMIRMGLEKHVLTHGKESEIELYFEDSPTIIRFTTILPQHNDRKVTKVAVIPNSFDDKPAIYGWCDTKRMFRTLYMGLLHICIRPTDWFKEDRFAWDNLSLIIYNKLESLIVERFLLGLDEEDKTPLPRHRDVASVEEMYADYGYLEL